MWFFTKNKTLPDKVEIIINAKKSNNKNFKLYFVNNNGIDVDTESIVKDYLIDCGLYVLRTEVAFWQAMTALVYWNEIYDFSPEQGNDIPHDLFSADFYKKRKIKIDEKNRFLLENGVVELLEDSIKRYKRNGYFSRLILDQDNEMDITNSLIMKMVKKIDTKDFCFITHNIIKDFNHNRAGLPDFVAWNAKTLLHVEAKRLNEKLLDSQIGWLSRFNEFDIGYKIIRVQTV
jgi:hypothetical protein